MSSFKNILVVGNGHSYTRIDYRKLPNEFKVMRFNSFYKEEKYYVGRKVDYCLCYSQELDSTYYCWRTVSMNREYEIDMTDGIYATVLFEPNKHFPSVKLATLLIQQNIAIAEFRCFYEYYHEKYLPTGIQGIALAAVLGFNNIYLAGFDFGLGATSLHIWDEDASSHEDLSHFRDRHPLDMQIEFLGLLKEQFQNTKILSVCEDSPINQYIKEAPIIRGDIDYVIEPKPENRTKEINIPVRIKNKNRDFS
jgi:alpha-2,3 sialyltransferase